MIDKLESAEAPALLAWMLGAGATGFGLGTLAAHQLRRYAPWLIVGGLIAHGWGMYKIYVRQ